MKGMERKKGGFRSRTPREPNSSRCSGTREKKREESSTDEKRRGFFQDCTENSPQETAV